MESGEKSYYLSGSYEPPGHELRSSRVDFVTSRAMSRSLTRCRGHGSDEYDAQDLGPPKTIDLVSQSSPDSTARVADALFFMIVTKS